MRKVVAVLSLVAIVALLAGCSKSPYDVGRAMAKEHCANGFNPSQAQQTRMQAEVERETASYTLEDKQEFMKGYLEEAMAAAMGKMTSELNQAIPGARSTPVVQEVRRSLPRRELPQRQW
jgi:hypothetical protein